MLKVLKSGFFTSIQDAGRFGYRDIGVPISGAMDMWTVGKLNMILENAEDAAVLEITMTGPTLVFELESSIVLGGAEMSATLNNKPLRNHKVYQVVEGDIVSYGRLEKGFRAYLAIKGGFKSQKVMGSRSMYFPVTPINHLSDRDEVPYDTDKSFEPKITEYKVPNLLEDTLLQVHKGPEYQILGDRQLEKLFATDFTIAKENNRMAYQLQEPIQGHQLSMLTSATLSGTVQLTPAGKLIILMKDGQTTGGYPRILQLDDKAISTLAQKKYGDQVSFKLA
ncbi:biotin-dependent carboxyltransferase family protein [Flavobacteriaceae bacterium TP-CH-4]|uniref:Biotin-dependent carboxyltransferase family protein n=1 Tax=Pelagihabitans pacificus TaxID=2696054 RepID=A0A967AVG8_9FLAO|nr:biotin-dependent carboxyltransferase family protein [Pelagihabitans pacificus]NHF60125.1 biotin-dependent carboxyltransferase family protein [Pelagihabitans pacificus]